MREAIKHIKLCLDIAKYPPVEMVVCITHLQLRTTQVPTVASLTLT